MVLCQLGLLRSKQTTGRLINYLTITRAVVASMAAMKIVGLNSLTPNNISKIPNAIPIRAKNQ
jgi:hypothetical protein